MSREAGPGTSGGADGSADDGGGQGRTVILVNPRAGSGRAAAVWERLRLSLPAGCKPRVVLAGDPTSAAQQLDEALAEEEGCRRLIAVGGDGTLHLAANRLVDHGVTDRVALGMVPAGTGSDLARTLGLPKRPDEALTHALTVEPRSMDLLRVTTAGDGIEGTRVVLNVASAGISGVVAGRVNSRPVKGATVYLTAALAALASYVPFRARVTVDGESFYDGGIYMLAVANGPSFGKGMRVAPEASVDDGLADVVVIEAMPRWRVPFRLPRLYLGNVLTSPAVRWCRGRRVELTPAEAMPPLEIDGETLEAGDTRFEILPAALRFLR